MSFGKSFPRKWLLYNNGIKGISLKFYADRKKAGVCLDLENPDTIVNELLYDQLVSLKTILTSEFLPKVIYDHAYELDNGKLIHRIYVPLSKKFSIHNKNTWRDCFEFFVQKMSSLEDFYNEYNNFLKSSIR